MLCLLQTLEAMLRVSGGDMRKAITFMQSASALYDRVITPEGVVEISGIFPDKDLEATLAAVKRGSLDSARKAAANIIASGYALSSVLERFSEAIIADAALKADAKAAIVEKIAIAEKRLADGADEELQLVDVLAHAARAVAGVTLPCDKERLIIM